MLITRTPFFNSRYSDWRHTTLFNQNCSIQVIADLGQGVLDSAMVECVAAVLGKGQVNLPLAFDCRSYAGNVIPSMMFDAQKARPFSLSLLEQVPNMPLSYWPPTSTLTKFAEHGIYERLGEVKQGLATKNNEQYVRLWWEVPATQLGNNKRWRTYAKGGEYARYYLPLVLVVDWSDAAQSVYQLRKGQKGVLLTNKSDHYLTRLGLTFSKRSQIGFSVRVMPKGTVFSQVGPGIFPSKEENLFYDIAFFNSEFSRACIDFLTSFGSYSEGYVNSLAYPEPNDSINTNITPLVIKCIEIYRRQFIWDETVREFTGLVVNDAKNLADYEAILKLYLHKLSEEAKTTEEKIEGILKTVFKLSSADEEFAREHAQVVHKRLAREHYTSDQNEESLAKMLLGIWVGIAFGRWDIRKFQGSSFSSNLPGPFEYLPACSSCMLVGPDALPSTPNRIVSEEWLCTWPNIIPSHVEGSMLKPTISDSEYPVQIAWDGILVDDADHPADIIRRIREILTVLWKSDNGKKAEEIEQEACKLLNVKDLREYLRRPPAFFENHLKRYSQSGRQAPIYWPLSTISGSYTLWVYYPRLTSDTLFTAINRYIEPKITEIQRSVGELEGLFTETTGREATRLREEVENAHNLLAELQDFRSELRRVAALPYRPDLSDGVIINAAPLYRLFRLPKWAKDTKECWEKLECGKYDWAHLAYTIWPDRVREKCRADRSIAITHNLEHLYIEQPITAKRKRNSKAVPDNEDEEDEE